MTLLRPGVTALSIMLFVTAPNAFAQTPEERAGARAAGEAGISAFDAGKYEEAIDLFERAERLLHAPTHLLYLARANLKLGRLVQAREYYIRISQERLPANASRPFRNAQESADKELAEVEPRVPYVSVVVQGAGAKNVHVTRDESPVPQPLLGVPHPVNPGQHTFKAVADGMESAPSTILLKEGARETVVLTLNQVAPAPASSAPAAAGTGLQTQSGFGTQGPTDSGPSTGGISGLRLGAYIGFGVAAVGAGLGTYFVVQSASTREPGDDLWEDCATLDPATGKRTCRDPVAENEINAIDEDANRERNIGIASFVVGGVGLATGVTLLILDLSKDKPRAAKAFELQPIVGLGYTGLRGTF